MSFHEWLLQQRRRPDEVGELACFAAREAARLGRCWNVISLWQHVAFRAGRVDLLTGWEAAHEEYATRTKSLTC